MKSEWKRLAGRKTLRLPRLSKGIFNHKTKCQNKLNSGCVSLYLASAEWWLPLGHCVIKYSPDQWTFGSKVLIDGEQMKVSGLIISASQQLAWPMVLRIFLNFLSNLDEARTGVERPKVIGHNFCDWVIKDIYPWVKTIRHHLLKASFTKECR